MAFLDTLPHIFIVIIAIVVLVFILKSLIKIALIIGAIGLVIYLLWGFNILSKIRGGMIPLG